VFLQQYDYLFNFKAYILVRKVIMDRACNTHKMRNTYKILIAEPERKRPLGRPRHRWEDNIKMVHKEIGCQDAY
jgi:hypothetical protein